MAESGSKGDTVIRDIARFKKQYYDLLVIGGGINGAAIAHLAAKRHRKVALLEQAIMALQTEFVRVRTEGSPLTDKRLSLIEQEMRLAKEKK